MLLTVHWISSVKRVTPTTPHLPPQNTRGALSVETSSTKGDLPTRSCAAGEFSGDSASLQQQRSDSQWENKAEPEQQSVLMEVSDEKSSNTTIPVALTIANIHFDTNIQTNTVYTDKSLSADPVSALNMTWTTAEQHMGNRNHWQKNTKTENRT